ncbi:MAG: glycosyltransferase family 4 protein, partial [Vulcanimicrobiaceae bacterium]
VYRGQNAGDQIRPLTTNPGLPLIEYLDQDVDDVALADLMRKADVLVHPYRGEAFAMPVLEAMACGVPVIVTSGGATDDYVDETVGWRIPSARRELNAAEVPFATKTTPWLFEPDANALMQLMRQAYDNRGDVSKRGTAAATRAAAWTWDRAAQIVESRLEDVMQRTPVAKRRHERYADAQLYAERILSTGELDGIIIELFKRLGVVRPTFIDFGTAVPGQTPATFVEKGLGWLRISADHNPAVDLAVFAANPTPLQIETLMASKPRGVTCPGSAIASFAAYTCIAIERTNGDALLVRDDLLEKAGFRAATLAAR